MRAAGELTADLARITRASSELRELADRTHRNAADAAHELRAAQHAVAAGELADGLRALEVALSSAGRRSATALAAFAEQVRLSAEAYRHADDELSERVRVQP